MWRYSFSDTGGYDCMTGGFHIWKDAKIIFTIDQSVFGQSHCDYNFVSTEAENLAKRIVRLLNGQEADGGKTRPQAQTS